NTDDLVCSLDAEGRLIVANSAMRRAFRERFGKEPVPGEPLFLHAPASIQEGWQRRLTQAFRGQCVRLEDTHVRGDRTQVIDLSFNPIFGEDGRPLGLTLFGRDVTERKEAETKLSEMHRSLLDVSRQAGMAEMATGLLHNVGNTLNSVNVSANLVTERIRSFRVGGLARAAELLREHSGDLCTFLANDPRGRQLPAYLIALSDQFAKEQQSLLAEQRTLTEGLEHVKSIVSMQQEHARFSGMVELMSVTRLIDDALRLHAISFERHGIQIHREYADVPPILLDRHKLLQIILNLLSNARHALADSGRPDKRITIRVAPAPEDRLRLQVSDNGLGIPPENLVRLFTQGFTTKKDGHGFGLHISALAAIEMAGSLTCESEGAGQGATFTLELPMQSEDPRI
ncbi:ATP-binding protein, partial [Archangium sp.]|uniref:ATP-binding protein n=1 Tax=Archangium sp. TaxID=1872627 RepID=UPI002D28C19F